MKKQPVQTTMYNEETNPIRISIPSLVPAESLPAFEKIGNIETKYILIYEKLRQMVESGRRLADSPQAGRRLADRHRPPARPPGKLGLSPH